jgi:hypothetical protein
MMEADDRPRQAKRKWVCVRQQRNLGQHAQVISL